MMVKECVGGNVYGGDECTSFAVFYTHMRPYMHLLALYGGGREKTRDDACANDSSSAYTAISTKESGGLMLMRAENSINWVKSVCNMCTCTCCC